MLEMYHGFQELFTPIRVLLTLFSIVVAFRVAQVFELARPIAISFMVAAVFWFAFPYLAKPFGF